MNSYRDLTVWQKALDLCVQVYEITGTFPKQELYGLSIQMRRCSVSIPSNIAEGHNRKHRNEFLQFLRIAYGSGAELETQMDIALRVKYIDEEIYKKSFDLLEEVMRMLNSLIDKFENSRH